jgi:hypothetical protein
MSNLKQRMLFKKLCFLLAAGLCIGAAPLDPKTMVTATVALGSVAYQFSIENGRLSGPGALFLERQGRENQFVLLGEPHNSRQVPQFTAALFLTLAQSAGYQYLALETDPLFAQEASAAPLRGSIDAMTEWIRNYPAAVTFGSDQEIQMIASVAARSTAAQPIWGVDQIFGITHVLDKLDALAATDAARQTVKTLADEIRSQERLRALDHNYLAEGALPRSFDTLPSSYAAKPGTQADFLLGQLLLSRTIYQNDIAAAGGAATGYDSSFTREENMKKLFLRDYKSASHEPGLPKAIVKLGQAHVMSGFSPANITTLGDFVADIARNEGGSAYRIALFLNGVEGDYGGRLESHTGYAAFADASSKDGWVLFDVRALRGKAFAGHIMPIASEAAQAIWQYDAVVLIPHPQLGTCNILRPGLQPAYRTFC